MNPTERYLVQRDWGGVPVVLRKHDENIEARTQAGVDVCALFPALREELRQLESDGEWTGLLYLYRGWTRQPLPVARAVVLGKRNREGLEPRIDVLDVRMDGGVEERWRAGEALLSRHRGMILRPALADVLTGGECRLLARTGAMRLVLTPLDGGEVSRMAGEASELLRCGAWDRRALGDGLVEMTLLDSRGQPYATARGLAMESREDARTVQLQGEASGSTDQWRLAGECWRAEHGEYHIKEEAHAEA